MNKDKLNEALCLLKQARVAMAAADVEEQWEHRICYAADCCISAEGYIETVRDEVD